MRAHLVGARIFLRQSCEVYGEAKTYDRCDQGDDSPDGFTCAGRAGPGHPHRKTPREAGVIARDGDWRFHTPLDRVLSAKWRYNIY